MAKSILELFQKEKLSFPDGKVETAQQHYAIRNSKEIEAQSKNPLLFLSFKAQKQLKRAFSIKDRETLFEEEVSGIRPLMLLSGPALYGTDLARLQNKTTDIMDEMRAASGGQNNKGLLSGVKKFIQKVATLGIKPTPQLIPTVVAKNSDFKKGKENETPDTLQKILSSNNRKGIGKFLAENVKGGFNENLGKRLISAGIDAAKQKAQKLLLGSRNEAGQNLAKSGGIYNSSAPYSKTVDYTNTDINKRNDLSDAYNDILKNVVASLFNPSIKNLPNRQIILGPPRKASIQKKSVSIPNVNAASSYTNIFNPTNTIYTTSPIATFNGTQKLRKFGLGLRGDLLNQLGVVTANKAGNVIIPINGTNKTTDALDFVPFKFENIASSNVLVFRATITSLSETFSPNWDSKTFVGNPLPFYSYGHIERSITISFKVFSMSALEHKAAWKRLGELARMVYPQRYSGAALKATAPFIELTLGDMFKKKVGFIESMTYTVPDNSPWEIGMNGAGTDEYKAPMIIEVELTYKFLLNRDVTAETTLYDFGGCDGYAVTTTGTPLPDVVVTSGPPKKKPPLPPLPPVKLPPTSIISIPPIAVPPAPAPAAPPPTAPPPTAPPPTAPPPIARPPVAPPTAPPAAPPPAATAPTPAPAAPPTKPPSSPPQAPPTATPTAPKINVIPSPPPPPKPEPKPESIPVPVEKKPKPNEEPFQEVIYWRSDVPGSNYGGVFMSHFSIQQQGRIADLKVQVFVNGADTGIWDLTEIYDTAHLSPKSFTIPNGWPNGMDSLYINFKLIPNEKVPMNVPITVDILRGSGYPLLRKPVILFQDRMTRLVFSDNYK